MSKYEKTPLSTIEADITLNYRRLKEARASDGRPLQELFEKRMNDALEEYGQMVSMLGEAATMLGETA